MEEDIKILEDFKTKGYSMLLMKYGDRNTTNLRIERAIENLIKGYRELEEKHNKLFACYNDRVGEIIDLENELESVKEIYYTQKDIETDYIPKSKVKEKIKKLEKEKQEYEEKYSIDADYCFDINGYNSALIALKKLMEDK